MTVADVGEDSVTLCWQKPKDEGGARLQGFVVEKRSPGDRAWKPVNERPVRDTELTVPALEPGEKYEFRVRAKNEAGFSEPSETTKPIQIKPKFCISTLFSFHFDPILFFRILFNFHVFLK